MFSSMQSGDIIQQVISSNVNHHKLEKTAGHQQLCEGNLKLLNTIECKHEVMCCRFSPDGAILAVGQSDGTTGVFSVDTGDCLYMLHDEDTRQARLPVTSLHFKTAAAGDTKEEHKHYLLATYASGIVKFWHYTSNNSVTTINEVRQTLASTFNPEGTRFITAGSDPQIYIYDAETKRRISTKEPSDARDVMNGHRLRVFAIACHPAEPHLFITGGWDDTVQFWDDREKHAVRKIYGPHICGEALDIDSVNGHILTGSWRKDHVLQIWDFNSGRKIKDVPLDSMQSSKLYSSHWLGKEYMICGGCEQNIAMVIDRGTLNVTGQIVDLPNGVYCIDNTRLGHNPKIAVGASNMVYILRNNKKD